MPYRSAATTDDIVLGRSGFPWLALAVAMVLSALLMWQIGASGLGRMSPSRLGGACSLLAPALAATIVAWVVTVRRMLALSRYRLELVGGELRVSRRDGRNHERTHMSVQWKLADVREVSVVEVPGLGRPTRCIVVSGPGGETLTLAGHVVGRDFDRVLAVLEGAVGPDSCPERLT